MAMPCRLGLSAHSVWIVFSAPEITTVSKPKRNPASADVSDQKKMRPFISESDDGSWALGLMTLSSPSSQWIPFLPPVPNPAVHRNHVGVAHLLQIVGGQRRAESAAAVKHNLRSKVRHPGLYVALDDALTQMNRARKVILGKFALFTHVHQDELFAAIQPLLHCIDVGFAYACLGVVHDLQKARRMLVGHKLLLPVSAKHRTKCCWIVHSWVRRILG